MKNKDIVVGQKYKHIDYPGIIYLGIGLQKNTGQIFQKHLIEIDSGKQVIPIGRQSGGDKGKLFWRGFSKIN